MALTKSLIWLYALTVLSSSELQYETVVQNCSSQAQLLERLSDDVKMAIECGQNLSAQQTAALLLSTRNLADSLNKHQLKECQGAEPIKCPEAEVPDNGGLACVTVNNARYCKPFCNYDYDFGFIRRSRLYDECSEQTGYKWDTQYTGGNKLAECIQASIHVSGAKSAYFPKDQDCLTTKSSSQLLNSTIEQFTAELKNQGIEAQSQYVCLACGRYDVPKKS